MWSRRGKALGYNIKCEVCVRNYNWLCYKDALIYQDPKCNSEIDGLCWQTDQSIDPAKYYSSITFLLYLKVNKPS